MSQLLDWVILVHDMGDSVLQHTSVFTKFVASKQSSNNAAFKKFTVCQASC